MMQDYKKKTKGRVCVTGGTGFVGSWMVKRLLEDGYSINATIRIDPEGKRDINFITNLPGASERLQIFDTDLEKPESFVAAIEGCIGVFHMAHPLDFAGKESEQVKMKRVIIGLQGILQACADSKTVRRVVYTSSLCAASYNPSRGFIDENSWTDVEYVRSLRTIGGHYFATKTLAEKTAFALAKELGLDLVSVLPTWITGPFISPNIPFSVHVSMALIFGDEEHYKNLKDASLVHVDDVARAHIHLFEHPNAKGRYLVSAVEFKIDELCHFISTRYPQFKMPNSDSWKNIVAAKTSGVSTKKLEETGFKYENGLKEMFDGAINSAKRNGLF